MKELKIFKDVPSEMPFMIARKHIRACTGGKYTAQSMTNLDAEGLGPKTGRIQVGRDVCYLTIPFLQWLEAHTKVLK